jgi:hypothetical protein
VIGWRRGRPKPESKRIKGGDVSEWPREVADMCPREMNSASKLVARKFFTSAEGFLNATSPWGPFFGDSQLGHFVERPWVFRGQGDSTWPLLASVFRENGDLPDGRIARFHQRRRRPNVPNRTQARNELYLLQRFFLLSDEQGLALPEDTQASVNQSFQMPAPS